MQGHKKLKFNDRIRNESIANAKQASNIDIEEARKTFRQMNNQSHYKTQYGGSNSPQKPSETEALKYKSFGQLHIVSILKPEVLNIIEQWLKINDVDEFKRRIYTTIRDMNTVIRNQ